MKWKLIALVSAAALAVSGCGDDTTATSTTQAPVTTAPAPTTTTTQSPATTSAPATTTTQAPAVTFTGADGVTSTITDTSRIVSLNGDLTEVIYALGLGDRVVAVDVTTTYPPETDALPRVGFGQQLAAEPVLGFTPTLVIGDQLIAPAESIQQIRDAGVPVVILTTRTTLDGVAAKIHDVAQVLGVPAEGNQLADRVSGEIADAQALAAGVTNRRKVAFLYTRGPQQIFLFGQGMVTQAMIEGANAIDVISESGVVAAVPLTPEALVAAAPDVIILPASGVDALGGLDAVAQLPGVAETPAGQNGDFLVYDDGLFLNFGPRTGMALRQLITDLYPELAG